MDFWLVDVKSTVNVNGIDVAFDYINTYLAENVAIAEAEFLTLNEDVLEVSVHKWHLYNDGTQKHFDVIPFRFINKNHRENK